jgi:hypothetical protein
MACTVASLFRAMVEPSTVHIVHLLLSRTEEVQNMAASLESSGISGECNATCSPRFCLSKCFETAKSALQDGGDRRGG